MILNAILRKYFIGQPRPGKRDLCSCSLGAAIEDYIYIS